MDRVKVMGYDPACYNVLLPTEKVKAISPFHIVAVNEVVIDHRPRGGEVYRSKNGLSLGKVALNKLASAAGIVWHPQETRCTLAEPRRCAYQAVGGLRKSDGSLVWVPACKEINVDVEEQEVFLKYRRRVERGEISREAADRKCEEEILSLWKHMHARCDTGARSRVIRDLLSLKSAYTARELRRPFVVPAIRFAPDWDNPEIRRKLEISTIYQMQTDFPDPPPLPVPLEEAARIHAEVERLASLPKWE